MAADSSDDPVAPISATTASVVPAAVGPKPNRPSPGGKVRSASKSVRPPAPETTAFTSAEPEPATAMPGDITIVGPEPGRAEPSQAERVPSPEDATSSSGAEPPVMHDDHDDAVPAETAAADLAVETHAAGDVPMDSPVAPAFFSAPPEAEPLAEVPAPVVLPETDSPIPAVASAVAPVSAEMPAAPTAGPGAVPMSTPKYHNKSLEIAMTTTHDLLAQSQANVEAVIKSGQIWTTGFQDIGRTIAESAQAQFDHTVGTWKALAGTKSLKEAFDIQSTRARAALEKAVADSSKLTDASLKLAEQAMAPITARITVATETFSKPV